MIVSQILLSPFAGKRIHNLFISFNELGVCEKEMELGQGNVLMPQWRIQLTSTRLPT